MALSSPVSSWHDPNPSLLALGSASVSGCAAIPGHSRGGARHSKESTKAAGRASLHQQRNPPAQPLPQLKPILCLSVWEPHGHSHQAETACVLLPSTGWKGFPQYPHPLWALLPSLPPPAHHFPAPAAQLRDRKMGFSTS